MRKNTRFITTVAALALLGAFLLLPLSWSQAVQATRDVPGWLARIISAPKDFNITQSLPPLELGRFVATKSKYALGEYRSLIKGASAIKNVLWVGEAFLKAEEAGYYVFSIISDKVGHKDRFYDKRFIAKAVYIEDVAIATGSDDTLMGAAELEPGQYKVEFRVVGDPDKERDAESPPYFDVRVKRPSDDRPLPISQVLLLSAPKK